MLRFLKILSLAIPFSSHGQTGYSPETIASKMYKLYNEGRLDSVRWKVTFYKNPFSSIDSLRWFYVYKDTLRFKEGSYAIGRKIIDPFMEYDGLLIGQWMAYYPNGKIFSKGYYAIGAYTDCDAGGPSASGYNYKDGFWTFTYDNGVRMASGNFKIIQITKMIECGIDTLSLSIPTNDWKFYDRNGNRSKHKERIIEKINNGS